MTLSLVDITYSTSMGKQHLKEMEQRLFQVRHDTQKAQRLKYHVCKHCYYVVNRIGGAAITTKPCRICDTPQTYSSTFTDTLCMDCAKHNGLCKQCGGDIDMKIRRKPYPFQEKNDEPSPMA